MPPATTLEELSYDFHDDDGTLVRKEIEKQVLSKGAWSTVMFLFQELDRKSGAFRAPKVGIVRFKKAGGAYRKQSSFHISSEKQGRQIMDVLERWYAGPAAATAPDDSTGQTRPTAAERRARARHTSASDQRARRRFGPRFSRRIRSRESRAASMKLGLLANAVR